MALGDNGRRRHDNGKGILRRFGFSGLPSVKRKYIVEAVLVLLFTAALVFWPSSDGREPVRTTVFVKPDGHVLLLEEAGGVRALIEDPNCPECRKTRQREMSAILHEALDTLTFVIDE